MLEKDLAYITFKKHSTTFFNASLHFPKPIKKDIFTLYNFVRTIDNFIDQTPQDTKSYFQLKKAFQSGITEDNTTAAIIKQFTEISDKYNFSPEWIDLFLSAMELDITKTEYSSMDELKKYMDGSAASIGYMLSQIIGIPKEAHPYARKFSHALQYINMIRDINEDYLLGRTYLPKSELYKYGLSSLCLAEAHQKPKEFSKFIIAQIRKYFKWQHEGKKGFKYFSNDTIIPIKTAYDLSNWTARHIAKHPFVIFHKKVKPSKFRIYKTILFNVIINKMPLVKI